MPLRNELVGSTTATLILSVLNTGSAHGYEIVRRINELSDGVFGWQEREIYPALRDLGAEGLILEQWLQTSDGQMKCVYSLTNEGRRTLISEAQEWSIYSSAVANILEASYA
jgi:PadR family transcriptional regulator, regulatory protein PadR